MDEWNLRKRCAVHVRAHFELMQLIIVIQTFYKQGRNFFFGQTCFLYCIQFLTFALLPTARATGPSSSAASTFLSHFWKLQRTPLKSNSHHAITTIMPSQHLFAMICFVFSVHALSQCLYFTNLSPLIASPSMNGADVTLHSSISPPVSSRTPQRFLPSVTSPLLPSISISVPSLPVYVSPNAIYDLPPSTRVKEGWLC